MAGLPLETRLTLLNWILIFNNFARTMKKTQPLYGWEGMFTEPLHSNGSSFIVEEIRLLRCGAPWKPQILHTRLLLSLVVVGMWLLSRCLGMNIYEYCDFIVPAFGRHVAIFSQPYKPKSLYDWQKIYQDNAGGCINRNVKKTNINKCRWYQMSAWWLLSGVQI